MSSQNSDSSAAPQYAVVVIQKLTRALEDEATAILFEAGAEGVSEDLPFIQRDLRYDPEIVATDDVTLKAYFTNLPSETQRLELETEMRRLSSSIVFSMTLENHKDWLEEWKKGFVPFLFADPFWIVPKWCEVPKGVSERDTLLMDPGMAFGTGTHETTKLAAAFIVEWMKRKGEGARVLDVGTGTGVLALITERLGAKDAVGLDIDPEARRTARENLELNHAKKTIIDDRDISEIAKAEPGGYDLVIANIIDGVLLILAEDLAKSVKPGGTMILSGILTDREDEFHREFAKTTGLVEQKRSKMNEWTAAVYYRDPAGDRA